MNAFNNINLAGACILTSTDYARKLGIPESKWIYPLGGAGTSDSGNCMDNTNLPSHNKLIMKQFANGLTSTQVHRSQDH